MIDQIWWKKYLSSYYFVCVTMNTVGYGDTVPQNDIEKLFCIFFIYAACGIFAYTLNVVGNIIHQISKNKSHFLNNIMIINEYMNKKNINFDLRMRIRKYLEYVWEEEQYQNSEEEDLIINKLSNTLKEELLLETNGKIMRQIPFFNNNFSPETLKKLVFKLREFHFMPGDIIFQKGDHFNNTLHILWKGEVELFMDIVKKEESYQLLQKIEKGKTFGEKNFITGCQREISARSSSFSTVFILDYNDFISVLLTNFDDYSKFFEIKDKVSLYNNYLDVKLICSYCQDLNHSVMDCPCLHLQVENQRVIQKYCYHKPNKRMDIIRRKKKTCNARKKRNFNQFVAKTIQKEHLFTDDELSDYPYPASESENHEKTAKIIEEYYDSSEEISFDFNKIMNSNRNSNTDGTNKNSKLNEKKPSDNKIASSDHIYSILKDKSEKNTSDELAIVNKITNELFNKSKFTVQNKISTTNSLKPTSMLVQIKDNNNTEKKYSEPDLTVIFEKKMDFYNYFPHNNSENVIRRYNQAVQKNNIDKITKNFSKKSQKSKKFLKRKATMMTKELQELKKKERTFENKNLIKLNSPKKSHFFNKFEETQEQDNLDKKAIIKILKIKNNQKNKNILEKATSWVMNWIKED